MSINLDQAQQTFIVEAREQLQAMEESLLQLETDPGDDDTRGTRGVFVSRPHLRLGGRRCVARQVDRRTIRVRAEGDHR